MHGFRNTMIGIGLVGVLGTCTVVNHVWERSEQTREIATPDFALENYRWFKNQSSAIEQVKSQIGSTEEEIETYRTDFEGTPRADWPWDAREELARKESVKRGYISQYNMLIKDYNAKSSDATRQWAEGSEPEEIKPFLRTYETY